MAASGHQAQSTTAAAAGITARRLPAARGRVRIEGPVRWDQWWVEPALVVLVLGAFIVYSTWAALQNAHYYAAPYLSPFYSPCLSTDCQHVTVPLFGKMPALPILGVARRLPDPLGARALPADLLLLPEGLLPVLLGGAAGVRGERRPPDVHGGDALPASIFQNLHRYISTGGAVHHRSGLRRAPGVPVPGGRFGIGVGTLVMCLNACSSRATPSRVTAAATSAADR